MVQIVWPTPPGRAGEHEAEPRPPQAIFSTCHGDGAAGRTKNAKPISITSTTAMSAADPKGRASTTTVIVTRARDTTTEAAARSRGRALVCRDIVRIRSTRATAGDDEQTVSCLGLHRGRTERLTRTAHPVRHGNRSPPLAALTLPHLDPASPGRHPVGAHRARTHRSGSRLSGTLH